MRTKYRIIPLLIFIALSVSVTGSKPTSASFVHSADATHAAVRAVSHAYLTADYTSQEKAQQAIPPLPNAVLNRELKALDGSTFKLADYRGNVVLVNLWATWCGPCRSDIPHLIEISKEFSARGVKIIGVTNEDSETEVENVKDFVREFKIPYKIGWGDQSFVFALMQGQVKRIIPQSFVISRDGRVLTRFNGFNQKVTPPKMRQAVEDALNEMGG